jgi:hypothetical protein
VVVGVQKIQYFQPGPNAGFVDVPATAEELASRLALSGTNIGGVEKNVQGGVIDAEVTSNRPDCLSVYGIAREVSAVYKTALKNVIPKPVESATKASDAVRVTIESPEVCARYTARVVRGVKIQPSPPWLRERLEAAGVASISNVVDVTNYAMLELGNPMHAFDLSKVRDHSIVVRRAKPGEKMRTLDGTERLMDAGMPLVCDGDGSRAIGSGVMGGAETKCDSAQGATVAEDLLTREPNLAAIYSACDDPAIAAAKVAKDKGKKLLVVGYDGLPDAAKAILDGDMNATIAQFPGKMAALAVDAAVKAVQGKTVAPFIDTGTELVTKANASRFLDFQ